MKLYLSTYKYQTEAHEDLPQPFILFKGSTPVSKIQNLYHIRPRGAVKVNHMNCKRKKTKCIFLTFLIFSSSVSVLIFILHIQFRLSLRQHSFLAFFPPDHFFFRRREPKKTHTHLSLFIQWKQSIKLQICLLIYIY